MAAGLQVFDATGGLVLDVTDRLTRVGGRLRTNGVAGSIRSSLLTSGEPWFLISTVGMPSTGQALPRISVSGDTLSWTGGYDSYITWGVF